MSNPKFDTYVAVFFAEDGELYARFVTGIPSRNTAEWKAGQPAMRLSEEYARDIVFGLTLNGHAASVVKFLHGVTLKNPAEASAESEA